MEYLSPASVPRAILKLLAAPPGSSFILLLIGLVFIRIWVGKLSVLAGMFSLYFFATPMGVQWLAGKIETFPVPTDEQITLENPQVIVVLTGGKKEFTPEYGGIATPSIETRTRLDYATYLHHKTGLPLIISGGLADNNSPSEAEIARSWLHKQEIPVMVIDEASRNTWESGRNLAELLPQVGVSKIILVTHSYHMKRSMSVMQSFDIAAIAAPTNPSGKAGNSVKKWIPNAGALKHSAVLINEYLGNQWYEMKYAL